MEDVTVTNQQHLQNLARILRQAYSGELAAAYAYRGHWKSVSRSEDRIQIQTIEEQEWHHRNLVGEMLRKIEKRPNVFREFRAYLFGRTLGILCYISGWFLPMYAAGKLESRNIKEYETAARLAAACNHFEFVDCLLQMAEVEWDHEHYFRSCVMRHPWSERVVLWPESAPRETIRLSFLHESAVGYCSVLNA